MSALKDSRDKLDHQLLALVVAHPRKVLVLAISTGMAVAQELVARRLKGELDLIGMSEDVCERACDIVLDQWASAARAGGITEEDFQKIVDRVVAVARAS